MSDVNDGFEGKVFFVDDEEVMRDTLGKRASLIGLDPEVFGDADSAVERLEKLDELTLAVVTDGLFGRWKDVVAAAKEAEVPAVVLTGDDIKEDVEEAGALFLSKQEVMKVGFGLLDETLAQIQRPDGN